MNFEMGAGRVVMGNAVCTTFYTVSVCILKRIEELNQNLCDRKIDVDVEASAATNAAATTAAVPIVWLAVCTCLWMCVCVCVIASHIFQHIARTHTAAHTLIILNVMHVNHLH